MQNLPTRGGTEEQRRFLANRLQQRLRETGMSQSDVARKMDTSRDNVSGWVRGTSFPRPVMLERLAEALGLRLEDLAPPELLKQDPAPSATFQLVAGKHGLSKVRVEAEMPADAAMAIFNILRDAKLIN